MDLSKIRFDQNGLAPVIAQDAESGEILMMAWANAEALLMTEKEGLATWWSRSRRELWTKGKTSGSLMRVVDILLDCDGDTLIYLVDPSGPACHTGRKTCFFTHNDAGQWREIIEK